MGEVLQGTVGHAIHLLVALLALGPMALLSRAVGPARAGGTDRPAGARVVRLDPRLDRLVPPGARLEKLADGFPWIEGPVWSRAGGYLLYLTADSGLYRIALTTRGAGVGR